MCVAQKIIAWTTKRLKFDSIFRYFTFFPMIWACKTFIYFIFFFNNICSLKFFKIIKNPAKFTDMFLISLKIYFLRVIFYINIGTLPFIILFIILYFFYYCMLYNNLLYDVILLTNNLITQVKVNEMRSPSLTLTLSKKIISERWRFICCFVVYFTFYDLYLIKH